MGAQSNLCHPQSKFTLLLSEKKSIIQETLLFILSLNNLHNLEACSVFDTMEKYRKDRLVGVSPKAADIIHHLAVFGSLQASQDVQVSSEEL